MDQQIEALDVQELWYPARIIKKTSSKVLVSFDGWSHDWDEWLSKNSKKLRQHRGWGGQEQPDDYQIGSIIEALDMDGKWCKAKVLHVAEHSVMVHYISWSDRWNEWIDKDAGRLRQPSGSSPRNL